MLSDLIIGTKLPNITNGKPWHTVLKDEAGKVLYAHAEMKTQNNAIDVFVKQTKNGSTKVLREINSADSVKQIRSLFDKNGKFIHCSVKENGKMVKFARTSLKKVKIYNLNCKINFKTVISVLKKLIFKR